MVNNKNELAEYIYNRADEATDGNMSEYIDIDAFCQVCESILNEYMILQCTKILE